MTKRICKNGHTYEKTSTCLVCPICSKKDMNEKYKDEFPQIGAPAFRALNGIGITELSQITKYTEEELLAIHGFGPKALKLIKLRLKENKLVLKSN